MVEHQLVVMLNALKHLASSPEILRFAQNEPFDTFINKTHRFGEIINLSNIYHTHVAIRPI